MADNEQILRTVFETDEQKKNALLKAYADLEKAQKRVASESLRAGDSYEAVAKESRSLAKAQGDVVQVMRALDKEWANQVTGVNEAKSALDSYEERLRAVQRGGADVSGDVASSFGGLRGATQAFGGGAVSPAFDILEGFADIGEFAPRLKVSLQAVGGTIRESTSAASQLASKGGDLISSFTGIDASLATVGVTGAVVAVALAGVAIAMNEYNKSAEEQRKVLAATIEAQRTVSQDIARGLTSEDATARLEELQRLRAAEADTLGRLEGAYGTMSDRLGILTPAVQLLDSREEELFNQVQTSQAAVASYDAEIARLTQAIENGELAANDTTLAELELARTREQSLQQSLAEQTQALSRIQQIENQRVTFIENAALQATRAEEDAALEARYAREDETKEAIDHKNNLVEIAKEGNARLRELEKAAASIPQERQQALNEIDAKGNQQLNSLRDEYFQSQLKATQDFAIETKRIETDVAKTRLRLIEDINERLDSAYRDNNVIAFLEAQREGNKELKRGAEDATESEKRRVEDFTRAREEEARAFQERQRDVLAKIAEDKQATLLAFEEKRQAAINAINAEKQAIQERLAQAQAAYDADEAREDLAAKRQAERDALREKRQQEDYNRQLANNQSLLNQELARYATLSAEIASLKAASSGGFGSSGGVAYGSNPFDKVKGGKFGSGSSGGSSYAPPPNASNASASQQRGGVVLMSVNYAPNTVVGDVASRSYVDQSQAAMAQGLGEVLVRSVQNVSR